MKIKCPRCLAPRPNITKTGTFFRKSDSKTIQRYKCRVCKKNFSSATFSRAYHQNKRRLNSLIFKDYCSLMSQRRIAIKYNISRTTVARKIRFLSLRAREFNSKWIEDKTFDHIQFDDLETIEHTKLKPVTVTLLVSEKRKIIGFGVARIPAKGHLAHLSRKKYGPRPSEAPKMRNELFKRVLPFIDPKALFESDEHPHYPGLVKKYFPKAIHQTFKGSRASISGQGELKSIKFDPLFKINHTFAMLRANINRLIRRTWNTTKRIEGLEDHIHMYVQYHNSVLT